MKIKPAKCMDYPYLCSIPAVPGGTLPPLTSTHCVYQFTSHSSWIRLTDILLCFISACLSLCPISSCRYLYLFSFRANWLPSDLSLVRGSRKNENLPFVWLVVVSLEVTLFSALYTPRLWLYFIALLYFLWLIVSVPQDKVNYLLLWCWYLVYTYIPVFITLYCNYLWIYLSLLLAHRLKEARSVSSVPIASWSLKGIEICLLKRITVRF